MGLVADMLQLGIEAADSDAPAVGDREMTVAAAVKDPGDTQRPLLSAVAHIRTDQA